jgi:4-hydroxybenzoate polyprenyltransferase
VKPKNIDMVYKATGLTDRQGPICVDLDGTLVKTDLFIESAVKALRIKVSNLFYLFLLFLHGKAFTKNKLAIICIPDPTILPYNETLISYLKKERENGRKIILATACDQKIAESIAQFLNIFDDVIASDGTNNLKGGVKAKALVERFGSKGFAYAGNSRTDLAVWRRANAAILVNTPKYVSMTVKSFVPIEQEFYERKSHYLGLIREIRLFQWVKNILVFIPLLSAHELLNATAFLNTCYIFLAFCAAASGGYLINDLLDLEADRNHPRKCQRPFASGELPLEYGLAGPFLILIALLVCISVSAETTLIISVYIALSITYSLYLKTKPIIDVFCLACLYTVRIIAGGVASNYLVSIWLLTFSGFLFLSLGMLKRYAENLPSETKKKQVFNRRGYKRQDSLLMIIMGVGSSFSSALVLGLYAETPHAQASYPTYILLWGIVPLVLFWQSRMWLSTIRGNMCDDPIVYAVKDKISILVFVFILLFYILASLDLNTTISKYFLIK